MEFSWRQERYGVPRQDGMMSPGTRLGLKRHGLAGKGGQHQPGFGIEF